MAIQSDDANTTPGEAVPPLLLSPVVSAIGRGAGLGTKISLL